MAKKYYFFNNILNKNISHVLTRLSNDAQTFVTIAYLLEVILRLQTFGDGHRTIIGVLFHDYNGY